MNDPRATSLLAGLAAIVFVSGCGQVAASPATAPPPPPSPTSVVPATPTPANVIPTPIVTDPGGVAAAIAGLVIPGGERLLPADVPPGMSASVRTHKADRGYPMDSYVVTYTDDLHTREITLSVDAGANPPPATDPNHSQSYIQFRGVRTLYTIFDTTAPTSQRYLLWPDEKGISTGPRGPDYFIGASGLTEVEFFRIANSLQPV
ncbi:MAG TPA: hypothetical protein VE953_00785 [Terriglobales bacterium]|nr:hypothetical protein [Terriglobales bacterium]